MRPEETYLRSRRVLLPDGLRPATIALSGGRIAAVLDHGAEPGGPVEDLGEAVLMASLCDTHVHVNEPGRTEWEGFETATRAAALGGVGLLVDMPLNSEPVTTSVSALEDKLAAASPDKLSMDVGFWGGVVPGNLGELRPMVDLGVLGFKCFLIHSGIDEFPEVGEAELRPAMALLREAGVPLLVHAELDLPVRDALLDASPREYLTYLHSRPREWEDAAIALMIRLCRETRCPVHIVHLSSATALPLIAAAKAEGLPLSVETCPHYLCLSAEEVPDGATQFKCAPPIRESTNREALWKGLEDGVIDFVVTDHSPCIPGLKLFEAGDFMGAWGGIASLQLGLASVWTEARRRGHGLERVHGWLSTGPLGFLGRGGAVGQGGARGQIAPGQEADLVAFEPDGEVDVCEAWLAHRHPVSPYLGRLLQGRVRHHWLRGDQIVDDGQLVGPPRGRQVLGRGPRGPLTGERSGSEQ